MVIGERNQRLDRPRLTRCLHRMVWKRTFNKVKPKYRISKKPDYYEKKAERLQYVAPPVIATPDPPRPAPKTKEFPARLKIVALHRECDVIVSFN
jgi:hypothetical protein